jgi:hypothetical protein
VNALPPRVISRSSPTSSCELRELLRSIFVAELIFPSRCLWLAVPDLVDIPLLDNRTGDFFPLEPAWANRVVRLAEILGRLVGAGTQLMLAAPPNAENSCFLERVQVLVNDLGLAGNLRVQQPPRLPFCGLLNDRAWLRGSLHLSETAVSVEEDGAVFDVNLPAVAAAAETFARSYGVFSP